MKVAAILQEIIDQRRKRLSEVPDAPGRNCGGDGGLRGADHPFLSALADATGPAIIAEVKLGSPRLGSLVDRINPETQAMTYAAGGAAALSVVVEPDFFFGSYDLLRRCKSACGLPTIAKDFVVNDQQLHWAREAGADAVLLIASLMDSEELSRRARLARSLGLVPLIETHDEDDLERLTGADWELVGVNNRDLRTFDVDIERSIALAPRIPSGALPVAESGLDGGEPVARLAAAGFRAFLVGESLLLAKDPMAKLADLRGVNR